MLSPSSSTLIPPPRGSVCIDARSIRPLSLTPTLTTSPLLHPLQVSVRDQTDGRAKPIGSDTGTLDRSVAPDINPNLATSSIYIFMRALARMPEYLLGRRAGAPRPLPCRPSLPFYSRPSLQPVTYPMHSCAALPQWLGLGSNLLPARQPTATERARSTPLGIVTRRDSQHSCP